ncbi:hypothetical protein TBLA_0D00640 [Henningerozyma blattae CBS 6284]|uniref:Kinesin motor domain-containing protein n=1 Tax=Henningerozyma blattae (strain ATCC 34711 / CBS 6284 / DSM 70876 / NBRC 10599 / NRRL Y-10934 / UCD 77-7) TaxID=1071380 RepID=I2H2G9_HENB6|nr:hypothetical protein TBLA_0D00640 [Tetrapisispora blattae CBS 6284]CCH60571.1 hypothetical protein TBLA_0D00640 [Tetrapisispora blattae CBS 6284]
MKTITHNSNIKVYVRCRSRNQKEIDEKSSVVVSTLGQNGNQIIISNSTNKNKYIFDNVFGVESDQESIFNSVAYNYIQEMIDGYNCTLFAYGQTGTGKTYTMSGDLNIIGDLNSTKNILLGEHAGIIPRVLVQLFTSLEDSISNQKNTSVKGYTVKISFLELYNERLKDLLSADADLPPNSGSSSANDPSVSSNIKIFDNKDSSDSSIIVKGMQEIFIKNAMEGLNLLMKGSLQRKVKSTKLNDLSSRSHTIFTITTNIIKLDNQTNKEYIKIGKLNLVDLAGSENITKSGLKRSQETGLINKSLLTLGRVINALSDKTNNTHGSNNDNNNSSSSSSISNSHHSHIPYRESKLTRLLQDSLGGMTKTCIIATISPAKTCLDETISTLEYATRAMSIKNNPKINKSQNPSNFINDYINQIDRLKLELQTSTDKIGGIFIPLEKLNYYKSNEILIEEQNAKINNMTNQIAKFKKKFVEQIQINKQLNTDMKKSQWEKNQLLTIKLKLIILIVNFKQNIFQYLNNIENFDQNKNNIIKNLNDEKNSLFDNSIEIFNQFISIHSNLISNKENLLQIDNSLIKFNNNFKSVSKSLFDELIKMLITFSSTTKDSILNIQISNFNDIIDNFQKNYYSISHDHFDNVKSNFQINLSNLDQSLKKYLIDQSSKLNKIISMNITNLKSYNEKIFNKIVMDSNEIINKSLNNFNSEKNSIIENQLIEIKNLKEIILSKNDELINSKIIINNLTSFIKNEISSKRNQLINHLKDSLDDFQRQNELLDDSILENSIQSITKSQTIYQDHLMDSIDNLYNSNINSIDRLDNHFDDQNIQLRKKILNHIDSMESLVIKNFDYNEFIKPTRDLYEELDHSKFNNNFNSISTMLLDNINNTKNSMDQNIDDLKLKINEKVIQDSSSMDISLNNIETFKDFTLNYFKTQNEQISKTQSEIIFATSNMINRVVSSLNESITDSNTLKIDLPNLQKNSEVNKLPTFEYPKDLITFDDQKHNILDDQIPILDNQNIKMENQDSMMASKLSPSRENLPPNINPTTPVPIPDQPLPRVLIPKSLNSSFKGKSPIYTNDKSLIAKYKSSNTTELNNRESSSNNLKRRFTADPVTLLNNQIKSKEFNRLHKPLDRSSKRARSYSHDI